MSLIKTLQTSLHALRNVLFDSSYSFPLKPECGATEEEIEMEDGLQYLETKLVGFTKFILLFLFPKLLLLEAVNTLLLLLIISKVSPDICTSARYIINKPLEILIRTPLRLALSLYAKIRHNHPMNLKELSPFEYIASLFLVLRLSDEQIKFYNENTEQFNKYVRMNSPTWRNVLGLKKGFTQSEEQKKYRSLSIKFHPDSVGNTGKMQEINEAHDTAKLFFSQPIERQRSLRYQFQWG